MLIVVILVLRCQSPLNMKSMQFNSSRVSLHKSVEYWPLAYSRFRPVNYFCGGSDVEISSLVINLVNN